MCQDCVKEKHPQRGTICLESGSYLMNFASCIACGRKEPLKITDKSTEEDEDGEELITYKHVCPSCDHIVATHEYTFRVEGLYQLCSDVLPCVDVKSMQTFYLQGLSCSKEYIMTCLLCGTAAASVSILPEDCNRTNHLF